MSFVHRFSIRSCSLQKKLGSLTIFAWGYCYCVLRRLWRHLVIKAIATRSLSGSCSRETVTKLDWCYQKFRNHGCVLGWVLFKLRIISLKRSAMSWLGFFPDADNFEPKLATTLTTSNKWEGEDEDDTVKVKYSLPNTLICHNDSTEVYWMYCKSFWDITSIIKCWRHSFCNFRTAGIWTMTRKRKMRRKANQPRPQRNLKGKFKIK